MTERRRAAGRAAADRHDVAAVPRPQRKAAPIVPSQNVAGRALVFVIAIMTFLSCLTLGAVTLVSDSAASLGKPDRARGDDPDQARRRARHGRRARDRQRASPAALPACASAQVVDREATARLLEPWLGAGPEHRRTAGSAPGRHHHRRGQPARFRADARHAHAGSADRPRSTTTAPGSTAWSRWRAPR